MIRHLVVFRWKAPISAEQLKAVDEALEALVPMVPSIRSYTHGADLGLGSGTWDYAIVADFDDADGWLAYDVHPAHDAVRREIFAPIVAERSAVRIALG